MNICNTKKLIFPGFCQIIPGWLVSMDTDHDHFIVFMFGTYGPPDQLSRGTICTKTSGYIIAPP